VRRSYTAHRTAFDCSNARYTAAAQERERTAIGLVGKRRDAASMTDRERFGLAIAPSFASVAHEEDARGQRIQRTLGADALGQS